MKIRLKSIIQILKSYSFFFGISEYELPAFYELINSNRELIGWNKVEEVRVNCYAPERITTKPTATVPTATVPPTTVPAKEPTATVKPSEQHRRLLETKCTDCKTGKSTVESRQCRYGKSRPARP